MYSFYRVAHGLRNVRTRVHGRHGFNLPKLFELETSQGSSQRVSVYRYFNRTVSSPYAEELREQALSRHAIAQFLRRGERMHAARVEIFDITQVPFDGHTTIVNTFAMPHGRTCALLQATTGTHVPSQR